jgi:hypothetical protein
MHEAEIEIDPSVRAEIERASTLVPPYCLISTILFSRTFSTTVKFVAPLDNVIMEGLLDLAKVPDQVCNCLISL